MSRHPTSPSSSPLTTRTHFLSVDESVLDVSRKWGHTVSDICDAWPEDVPLCGWTTFTVFPRK